jgi:hypothetical protein
MKLKRIIIEDDNGDEIDIPLINYSECIVEEFFGIEKKINRYKRDLSSNGRSIMIITCGPKEMINAKYSIRHLSDSEIERMLNWNM